MPIAMAFRTNGCASSEHVDLPTAQGLHLGLRVLDERDDDLLNVTHRGSVDEGIPPVVLVANQLDVLILCPRIEDERARTHRD
jgi:hypothetical protein